MSWLTRQEKRDGAAGPAERLIDLTGSETEAGSDTDTRPTSLAFGQPGPCPVCGGPGYLDRINLVKRVMHQHCRECAHRWQTSHAETVHVS